MATFASIVGTLHPWRHLAPVVRVHTDTMNTWLNMAGGTFAGTVAINHLWRLRGRVAKVRIKSTSTFSNDCVGYCAVRNRVAANNKTRIGFGSATRGPK